MNLSKEIVHVLDERYQIKDEQGHMVDPKDGPDVIKRPEPPKGCSEVFKQSDLTNIRFG